MLINCPKCDFEQPKDDYCAKCGVHIPSFAVPEVPLQQKALGSASFYGFLFVVLILGAGFYFNAKFKGFENKIEELNVNQLSELVTQDQIPTKESATPVADETEPDNIVERLESRIQEAKENDAGPKALKDTTKEALDWGQYSLELRFIEAQSEINDEDTTVRQQGQEYQILKHQKGLNIFNSASLLENSKFPINDLSFSYLSPTQTNSQIEMQFNWELENHRVLLRMLVAYSIDAETTIASGLSFSDYLKPGQDITIKGVLPRIEMLKAETISAGPLLIFRSDAFLAGESDFYIQISIPEIEAGKQQSQ